MLTEDEKVETLDEVWDNAELEEDEKDEEQEEEAKDEEAEEEKVEETEEAEEAETDEEDEDKKEEESRVDWEGLGFEKFKGKTDKEVVKQIKFERQQLGRTVNMLGDLRREIADMKKRPAKEPEKAEKPKDILASMADMDEAEAAKYNAMYEKNAPKAIMTYIGDPIKQMVADAVKEAMPRGSVEEVKEEIAYSTFINTAKPNDVEIEQMRIFDKEEYLGAQKRSYADLHGLSKMWLTQEAGAEDIYNLMKKHPTLSFDEAHSFVVKPEEKAEKVKIDKQKIKETINKNKKVESHPKKKAQALPSSDLSFDEAWDNA